MMGYWGQAIRLGEIETNPLDNQTSTLVTIHQMTAIAKDSARYPIINKVVAEVQVDSKGSKQLVRGLYWWVKNHVTFREDEDILTKELGYPDPYHELLISPVALLSMLHPEGDCDDFSMLTASLMVAAKIPVWFVAIAVDEKEQDRWSHIYCKVYLPDESEYMILDTSHGKFPGWETNRHQFKRMEWRVA